MGKYEQTIGQQGEALARSALERLGVEQVEKIGTPVIITRSSKPPHKITGAIFGEPVAADFRGVWPLAVHDDEELEMKIGMSVMAEVKTILDGNLCFSDFRKHQPEALSTHADFGGMSLVVWVHTSGVYVLPWPIPGFGRGKSISPEAAKSLDMQR
jgi:hypothetical protein